MSAAVTRKRLTLFAYFYTAEQNDRAKPYSTKAIQLHRIIALNDSTYNEQSRLH